MCGPKPYGNFFVYFACLLGNFLTISYGFMFGMSPQVFTLFKSEETFLSNGPLTDELISWITTYMFIGAGIGAIFFKHLSHGFGRRATLMIAGIIQNLGWFGAVFGYNYTHICISRFMVGLTGGSAFTVLPIFFLEISQTTTAVEKLHVAIYMFQGLGIMVGYLFTTFADHLIASIAGMVISVLFSMCFPFVQESPKHFMQKNDITMLEKSLRYFRAIRDLDQRSMPEYINEVEKFKQMRKSMNGNSTLKNGYIGASSPVRHQSPCSVFQACISGLVLVITAQLCGFLAILNYSAIILEDIGTILPVDISSLLLGIAAFVGSLLGLVVAPCSWRKFVVVSFSLVTGLCLATLGYFIQRKESFDNFDFDMRWIPLICLILFVVLASASIYPMAFVILAEVFSHKNLDILHTFYHALYWVLGALLIKYHFQIIDCIEGMHIYFWAFSGFCLFQCVALIFILPKRQQQKNL